MKSWINAFTDAFATVPSTTDVPTVAQRAVVWAVFGVLVSKAL